MSAANYYLEPRNYPPGRLCRPPGDLIEQRLDEIEATDIEREVAYLVKRTQGRPAALRVIAGFRDGHPAEKQLSLFGELGNNDDT